MSRLSIFDSATATCAAIAVSLVPAPSYAGVMSITDKASVSLPSPAIRLIGALIGIITIVGTRAGIMAGRNIASEQPMGPLRL